MFQQIWKRFTRDVVWLLITLLLLWFLSQVAPQQILIVPYKLALITLSACVGFWLDRSFFPYARPDGYLVGNWHDSTGLVIGDANHPVVSGYTMVFAIAMIRRALIIAATVIGFALGV